MVILRQDEDVERRMGERRMGRRKRRRRRRSNLAMINAQLCKSRFMIRAEWWFFQHVCAVRGRLWVPSAIFTLRFPPSVPSSLAKMAFQSWPGDSARGRFSKMCLMTSLNDLSPLSLRVSPCLCPSVCLSVCPSVCMSVCVPRPT